MTEYTASVLAQCNTIEQPSHEHRAVPNSSPDGPDYAAVIVWCSHLFVTSNTEMSSFRRSLVPLMSYQRWPSHLFFSCSSIPRHGICTYISLWCRHYIFEVSSSVCCRQPFQSQVSIRRESFILCMWLLCVVFNQFIMLSIRTAVTMFTCCSLLLHVKCETKMRHYILLSIASPNIYRFSKFFHH